MNNDASTISSAIKDKDAVGIEIKNVSTLSAIPESERETAIDTVAAAGMRSLVSGAPLNVFVEQYTEEDYKTLVRKIDFVLLPLMWVLYGLQQADKTGISMQATFNMRADLVFEAPGNYVMQRTNIGKMLAVFMFFWGVIVLCTGFVTTWAEMMVLRALQGVRPKLRVRQTRLNKWLYRVRTVTT